MKPTRRSSTPHYKPARASVRPADSLARRFYDEFRNGLVHEARLKEGAQFSLEIQQTVEERQGLLLVNPRLLAGEVRAALGSYVTLLERKPEERQKLADALRRDHDKDFQAAGA